MAVLSPVAKQQFFTDAGVPAAGYLLYTYAANSTTPQATYTNAAGSAANANPIVLDTQGRATIFIDAALVYDFVLKTASGVTVWTQEDVQGVAQASVAAAEAAADAAAASTFNVVRGDSAKQYRTFGGVIRQASAGVGWAFIDDTDHTPIGLTSLTENADGTLTVTNAFTAQTVGDVAITPDEDYAAAGLTMGASVTKSASIISFYAPFEARLSGTTVAWGNYITTTGALFGCDTSGAATTGKIVFTHPGMTHTDAQGPAVVVSPYYVSNTQSGNAAIAVMSNTKTGFTLQAMEAIAGRVTCNGSGTNTVTHELVTAPTVSWDGTSKLTIDHNAAGAQPSAATSPYAKALVVESGSYSIRCQSSTDTTLVLEFYDSSGTKFTGANAPAITFTFWRPGLAPGKWSANNRVVVRRGTVNVRCQDVSGSGNVWVKGTHEVA